MKIFRKLWWFFRQERKAYGIGVALLLLVALGEVIPPKVVGLIVDHINEGTLTPAILGEWIVVLVGVALTLYVARFGWRSLIFGAAYRLGRLLRRRLYDHFTKMSPSFYQRKRIGDLMAHATNDISAVQQTAGMGILTLIDSVSLGSFVLVTMTVTISWKLTLIALIPMPFMALATNYYGSLIHSRFKDAQEAFSSLNDRVQESMSGMKVIKSFGKDKEDIAHFERQLDDVLAKNMKVAKVDALFDPTISIVVGMSFMLSIGFGAREVMNGALTIGQLVSFTTYLGILVWPMLALGWLFNIVQRGSASYDRIESLLAEEVEVLDGDGAKSLVDSGDLVVAVKQFQYPTAATPTLQQITIEVASGKTLGIVGRTGAGKSTILKLLLREFDQYDGTITYAGHNVKDVKVADYRAKLSYVPQEPFLFSTTIGENIAFSDVTASQATIERMAKLAHIHDDITQLANGYDTEVGERGVSLSGGQRQRLSIARALLANSDILMLDDSLSAVDARTEEAIVQSLKETRQGKTTIITTHRLSAISHADEVIVLEEGRIIQRGTHDELITVDGWYKETWQRQQLEALVEEGR